MPWLVGCHVWSLSDRNLMLHLHAVGYRIAFLEPNPFYPKLGTEYTLVKNTSCY